MLAGEHDARNSTCQSKFFNHPKYFKKWVVQSQNEYILWVLLVRLTVNEHRHVFKLYIILGLNISIIYLESSESMENGVL